MGGCYGWLLIGACNLMVCRIRVFRSSDGNVVTACHDKHKVRILIDGGFTRLMDECWDKTAGTARFVTNAACWLYNWEGRQKPRAIAAAKKSGGRSG